MHILLVDLLHDETTCILEMKFSNYQFDFRKRVQQRLALYQGVCPIYMEFLDDAEATFSDALALLQASSSPHGLVFVSRFESPLHAFASHQLYQILENLSHL